MVSQPYFTIASYHLAHFLDVICATLSKGLCPSFAPVIESNRANVFSGHRDHKDTVHSDWLRGVVRGICEDYIKRVTRELGIPHPKDIINPMDKLISLNIESKIKAHLLIGGPFTEPLKYVTDIYHRGGEVIGAYAMAAYVKGEVNLFENQFNFFVDMKAAEHFLNFVIEHRIPLSNSLSDDAHSVYHTDAYV